MSTILVNENGERFEQVFAPRVHYVWSGAGTTAAPTSAIPLGAIGVNADGATTGNVYHWTGAAWTDTGATVAQLYGGA